MQLGEAVTALEKPYLQEPYRHKLALMKYRLECNLDGIAQRLLAGPAQPTGQSAMPRAATVRSGEARAYPDAQAFLADLFVLRDSLAAHGDAEAAARIYGMIGGEHQRGVDWILEIAGSDRLLSENPALAASLSRRNALLGPLNYLQVALLKRVRRDHGGNSPESPWLTPLLRTINAIAAGMRNTG
jgi:phosphoenolpyruvate carboxylase